MGMWVQGISMEILEIQMEMQKMWGISVVMQGIKVETEVQR